MYKHLTWICLFLLFNSRPSFCADVNSVGLSEDVADTKNIVNLHYLGNKNQSDIRMGTDEGKSMDTSVGRTFGRPMKKLAAALIPLAFQIGAASTWAVVAALVGVKTLVIALLILKLLLVAGATKFGALFAHKTTSHHSGWEQPHQKEIHLHIHNGHHDTEEHIPISSWNRDGNPVGALNPYAGSLSGNPTSAETKNLNFIVNPYAGGPQTIHTPFGNYVRVDHDNPNTK